MPRYDGWDATSIEFNGKGWEGVIQRVASRNVVYVKLANAKTKEGLHFAQLKLPLNTLTPLECILSTEEALPSS